MGVAVGEMKLTCVFAEKNPWPELDLFTLSHTTAMRFNHCPWVYAEAKPRGTPERQSTPAGRGRLLHEYYRRMGEAAQKHGLAYAYEHWAEILADALEAMPCPAELLPILKESAQHFAENLGYFLAGIDNDKEINLLEQMFWVRFDDDNGKPLFILNGRIDRVRYDKGSGYVRVCDYKTPDQIQATAAFEHDPQGATYCIAVREWLKSQGLPVKGYQVRHDFTAPKCGCHYHLKAVTDAEIDDMVAHFIRTGKQVAALLAAWPGNDAPLKAQWRAATPSPGQACNLYEQPCPFVWRCQAVQESGMPVILTAADAERVLGELAAHKAAASARRKAVQEWVIGAGIAVSSGGLTASVEERESVEPLTDENGNPSIDAIADWLRSRGRPLSDALLLNGRKKAVIEEMLALPLPDAETASLTATLADENADELAREMARDRLAAHPTLVRVAREPKFDVRKGGG